MALALDRPVIGIDTFRAIAANAVRSHAIAVVTDARHGEVYFALFRMERQLLAPQRVSLAEAVALLREVRFPSWAREARIVAEAARVDVTI